jgi:hypothetical protein
MGSNEGRSYDFTEGAAEKYNSRCIENVQGLLKSAEILPDDKSTVQYPLGLHTYVVEEYGKAHLLKSHLAGIIGVFLPIFSILSQVESPAVLIVILWFLLTTCLHLSNISLMYNTTVIEDRSM